MDPTQAPAGHRTRPCGHCGYRNVPWARSCGLCGDELGRLVVPGAGAGVRAPATPWRPSPRWTALGLGLLLAPAITLLPLLRYVGWFLASLLHEIGHCVAAWLFGMPAWPAIRIDGHAAALHGRQHVALVLLVVAAIAWLTWRARHRPVLRVVGAVALVVHPLLAFGRGHDLAHLLAGHLGELAFAGVFLVRALSGGFTSSAAERVLYALLGWYLLGRNVVLDVGLVSDAAARSAYLGNGSFGMEQDFLRAARHLGWSLEGVARLMLLACALVPPVAWWAWRRMELVPDGRAGQNGG
jgi:hypothetical protein